MATQSYATITPRLGKYKGALLKYAVAKECLALTGRQVRFPKNNSDTYVARRYLPYGATATDGNSQNRFYQDGNGDRGQAIVQAHQMAEGITPAPDSIQSVDITVVMQQYSCLYGFTDKTADLYEDRIPDQMIKQVGERVAFVNELIMYGYLRGSTNQFYGGAGTSLATVNGGLTLGFLRRISQNLQANHAVMITSVLAASGDFDTQAVGEGYLVYCHTDMEPDIRDLPNFVPTEKYASGTPMRNELGKCERFRFITSADLPPIQNGGAANAGTGFYGTTANMDVYPIIVTAEDAYSQVAVRGLDALDPTYIPPGQKDKSDPHGQRGYAGTKWYKAVMIENQGWMAVGNVARKVLL